MALVYEAKAIKDGKKHVYIGYTYRSLDERKKEHFDDAFMNNSQRSFHRCLREVVFNNWEWRGVVEYASKEEAKAQEEKLIKQWREKARYDSNIIILNDTVGKNFDKAEDNKSNAIIPRAYKQINYAPGNMARKLMQEDGKIQPVINLKTKKKYKSILEAERKDHESRSRIKNACETGRMLSDGTRYAYLDLDDKPVLKKGHSQDRYIGKNARKIKELTNNKTYDGGIAEVVVELGLSSSSVDGLASGKYMISRGQHVFCYLDEDGNEIRTERHEQALLKIKNKNKIKYVAWPVEFTYEEALDKKQVGYFKTPEKVCEGLEIKNKSHVKAVCDGKRSHVEKWRIAFYDHEKNKPILTAKHKQPSKKVIRKVICLEKVINKITCLENKKFSNCTEAGAAYGISAGQIGLCARGRLRSVRFKNEQGELVRLRFAYLNAFDKPILKVKHRELLGQRKGVKMIRLINEEVIKLVGKDRFCSIAEFCKETGVPYKSAKRYLDRKINHLFGYEFNVLD